MARLARAKVTIDVLALIEDDQSMQDAMRDVLWFDSINDASNDGCDVKEVNLLEVEIGDEFGNKPKG